MGKVPENIGRNAVGRTKTIIVLDTGDSQIGVVSEIFVRTSSDENVDRLAYRGPVKFKDSSKKHLESVVLPIVDRITGNLGNPLKNYEISLKNIGATASAGIGIEISGFSADLPIFLSLISASLQVGIRQDVVCTGHVASIEGDLAPVRGIPAKFDAALSTPGISAFVLPDMEKDRSLPVLTPIEYQAAKESLLRHKGALKVYSVSDVHGATRICMTDESILIGSLTNDFYNATAIDKDLDSPVSMTVSLFSNENDKRFWESLEHLFLSRGLKKASFVLQRFVSFHAKHKCYPEDFGKRLLRLVISLPPSIQRLDDIFPLIPMESFIKLSQFATKSDHEDVRQLYKAVFGEAFGEIKHSLEEEKAFQALEGDRGKDLVGSIMAEIREEIISEKVGQPLDKARASFVMDANTVKDSFEFNKAITAFYAHIFRHTRSSGGFLERAAFSAEAIDLVKNAYAHKGGYEASLSEGKHGLNGGMRLVFDAMTEYLKKIEKEKYITRVFKETIDPSDWDSKVRLTEALKKLIEPYLPAELNGLPTKQLALHWEEIIRCYVESMDKVSDLLKRF